MCTTQNVLIINLGLSSYRSCFLLLAFPTMSPRERWLDSASLVFQSSNCMQNNYVCPPAWKCSDKLCYFVLQQLLVAHFQPEILSSLWEEIDTVQYHYITKKRNMELKQHIYIMRKRKCLWQTDWKGNWLYFFFLNGLSEHEYDHTKGHQKPCL